MQTRTTVHLGERTAEDRYIVMIFGPPSSQLERAFTKTRGGPQAQEFYRVRNSV